MAEHQSLPSTDFNNGNSAAEFVADFIENLATRLSKMK